MQRRVWLPIVVLAAVLFGVMGVARLVDEGDTQAFAHLTMAIGLILVVVRERMGGAFKLSYAPEVLLLLAILQYGYHVVGL